MSEEIIASVCFERLRREVVRLVNSAVMPRVFR